MTPELQFRYFAPLNSSWPSWRFDPSKPRGEFKYTGCPWSFGDATPELLLREGEFYETDASGIALATPDADWEGEILDEFRGDDEHLRQCIKALIKMNDDGVLVPHGIGGHARALLAASYHRLVNQAEYHGDPRTPEYGVAP